jgi:Mn-containing catalase
MLNRSAKGKMAEGPDSAAELYREVNRGGSDRKQAILAGGGVPLADSAGVPWTGHTSIPSANQLSICAPTSPRKHGRKSFTSG